MAISYVGSASAAATSVTLPAHVAGDLIYIFTFRNGSTTAPTIPSGWLPIAGGPGANTCSFRQGFRIARGASETSGTWTNATHIVAVVMRGTLGIGKFAPYEFTDEEKQRLKAFAAEIAVHFDDKQD